jgi:hypothetical protein
LYWFGVLAFTINFLMQLTVLLYQAYTQPFIRDGKFRIIEVKGNKAPCSFLNFIFINPEKYDWDTYSQILQHEKTHVAQKHSVDILLAEIALIFQWFNPFAWLYRKEIENNLEFLTDNELLEKEHFDRSAYQISLLKVSAPHFPLGLTANYNQSLLKRRLLMMDAKKSNVHTSWKYFFLLPLLFLFMSLFGEPIAQSHSSSKSLQAEMKPVTEDAAPPSTGIEDRVARETGRIQKPVADDKIANVKNLQDSDRRKNDLPATKKGVDSNYEYNSGYDFKFNSGVPKNDTTDIDALTTYVQSLEQTGYRNLSLHQLSLLKSAGVSADFIKTLHSLGFSDIQIEDLAAAKKMAIGTNYINQVRGMGYPDINMQQVVQFKRLGISEEYIRKFGDLGFKNIPAGQLIPLKFHKATPELAQEYRKLGISVEQVHELTAAQVWGLSPAFVVKMKEKGYTYTSLQDYIKLKDMLQ